MAVNSASTGLTPPGESDRNQGGDIFYAMHKQLLVRQGVIRTAFVRSPTTAIAAAIERLRAAAGAPGPSDRIRTVQADLDTAWPEVGTVDLALTRLQTAQKARRIGSLIVNPGGPGSSAVEYLQAQRVRSLIIQQMHEKLKGIDVYLSPSFAGSNLVMTNLSGHPCVVLPNGFQKNGMPTTITFMGQLYGEAKVLALAKLYQDLTNHDEQRPPMALSSNR